MFREKYERCERCKYFEEDEDVKEGTKNDSDGYCCRYPPEAKYNLWPTVHKVMFCGEGEFLLEEDDNE